MELRQQRGWFLWQGIDCVENLMWVCATYFIAYFWVFANGIAHILHNC